MATNQKNEPKILLAFLEKHNIQYKRDPYKTGVGSVIVEIKYHFDELHTTMQNILNDYNNY